MTIDARSIQMMMHLQLTANENWFTTTVTTKTTVLWFEKTELPKHLSNHDLLLCWSLSYSVQVFYKNTTVLPPSSDNSKVFTKGLFASAPCTASLSAPDPMPWITWHCVCLFCTNKNNCLSSSNSASEISSKLCKSILGILI